MPFTPELFSARVLERLEEQRRHELASVPYFDGLLAGEPDALVKSFAGVPELHDPVRGRVKGVRAFEAFVSEASSWLRGHNVSVEHVEHVITERQGFDEVVLHLDGQVGRVDLPVAIVADRRSDGRIDELRIYFSNWPLAGRHTHRPPLSQPIPSCLSHTSWATTSARSRRATSTRSWRHSNPTATPASPRAADASTGISTA